MPPCITGADMDAQQAARLLARIDRAGESEGWPWLGSVAPNGYGQVVWRVNGRRVRLTPHRLAWEWWTGAQIPTGYEIDHICTCRTCCNPRHLECVTHAENMRRMGRRRSWRDIRDYQLRLAHIDSIQGE